MSGGWGRSKESGLFEYECRGPLMIFIFKQFPLAVVFRILAENSTEKPSGEAVKHGHWNSAKFCIQVHVFLSTLVTWDVRVEKKSIRNKKYETGCHNTTSSTMLCQKHEAQGSDSLAFVSDASLNYYRRRDVWFNESSWETFLCLHIQIYTEQHKWRYHLLLLRVFRPIKPLLCEWAAQRWSCVYVKIYFYTFHFLHSPPIAIFHFFFNSDCKLCCYTRERICNVIEYESLELFSNHLFAS